MELEDIRKQLDGANVEEMTINELRSVEETMRNCRLILNNSAQLIGSYKIAGNPTNCDLCSEIEETQSLLRALIYEQSGIYGDFARRLDKELRRRLSITQSILDAAKDFND
mgnify:CR=1 FL=1